MNAPLLAQGRDYEHTLEFDRFAPGWHYEPGDAPAIGRAVTAGQAFDAAEFSLSSLIARHDKGKRELVAIPVFPARAFIQSYLFVRADSPLRRLEDLRGRHIGMRDYASTGAIWFRGMLADKFGIAPADIRWTTGPKARMAPPPGISITPSEADLEDLLLAGEIDLFFSARVRDHKAPPAARRIRHLLPDTRAAEAAWLAGGGAHPIIHTVVLSKACLAAHPLAAQKVFAGYAGARRAALRRRLGGSFLPWSEQLWDDAVPLFGGEPLPYGLTAENRRAVTQLGQYMQAQGLIATAPAPEVLFHPDAAGWTA